MPLRKLGVLILVGCVVADRAPAQLAVRVDKQIQVSRVWDSVPHGEVQIAIAPDNPRHLIACSMVEPAGRGGPVTVVYHSADGGQSWKRALVVDPPGYGADPECEYGSHGVAYYAALISSANDKLYGNDRTEVYQSTDWGQTWKKVYTLAILDHERIEVDRTGGRFNGRFYMLGKLMDDQTFVNGKVDYNRGGSALYRWDGAHDIAHITTNYMDPLGNVHDAPVVLSDGRFVFVAATADSTRRYTHHVMESRNGGKTFKEIATLTPERGTFWKLAVDGSKGPFRDRIYGLGNMWDPVAQKGHGLFIITSDDAGRTWSEPVIFPKSGERKVNLSSPEIAVGNTGVVGISWYQTPDSTRESGSQLEEVYFIASNDGGQTFTAPTRVNSLSGPMAKFKFTPNYFVLERPADTAGKPFLVQLQGPSGPGHYMGLATDPAGGFRSVWVDGRTGVHQLWTTHISIDGRVVAGAKLVSDSADARVKNALRWDNATIEYHNTTFDANTGIATFDIVVRNRGNAPLPLPRGMRLELTSLESVSPTKKLGFEVLDDAGKVATTGASWPVEPADVPIAPGQTSKPLKITLRILLPNSDFPPTALHLRLKAKPSEVN